MTTLRVMVVDDEPLAREGLAELLNAVPDVTVIGGKDHEVLTHGHGDTVEMQLDHGSRF